MNIYKILNDSMKYPFSDLQKFIILGGIYFLTSFLIDVKYVNIKNVLFDIFAIIGLTISIFTYGYLFRIINTSLKGDVKLPDFADLGNLFRDGIKLLLVSAIYYIPLGLFLIISASIYYSNFSYSVTSSTMYTPIQVLIGFFEDIIIQGIEAVFPILINISQINNIGIIIFLYTVLITPIMLMAIVHMANNNCKIHAALKLRELFSKIGSIGWNNLIIWSIIIGFIYLVVETIITNFNNLFLGFLYVPFIIIPFLYIFIARSMALFYRYNKKG